MSHEDILDDMSLSDDEMLDNLADDLLMEMEKDSSSSEEEEEEIETIQPVRSSYNNNRGAGPMMPTGFPFPGAGAVAGGGGGAPAGMPDLGKMMQQMMPMMSQMFGGAGGAGRGGGNAALQQPKLPWDEIVRQHVPQQEQDDWLRTIRADEKRQRDDLAAKKYSNPPSRSFHGNAAKPLPNVYMESETLLASMLNEAVRARKAEHNTTWAKYHENLVSHLTQSGLASVFTRELKDQLRRRVESDPDYAGTRAMDATRFSNIAKALHV